MAGGRVTRKKKPTKRELEELATYEGLKELAESLGWSVTIARTLEGRGGSCVVRGERRAILAARLPLAERAELLAEALRREDLESVYVRPDLRALLGESASAPAGGTEGA